MSIVSKSWDKATSTPKRKKLTRIALGLALLFAVPALWLAWWLGSPLLIDDVANEDFPLTASATIPNELSRDEAEMMMEIAAKLNSPMSEDMTDDMSMSATISLKTGMFRDEDRVHKGSGTATLYRLDDGTNVLRLEDLNVTNGPDLHVLLMVDPEGRDKSQGYLDLGKLKGNIGNQNYPLPTDANGSTYNAVMIYCQPFHVVFSTAPLSAN
ncbi:DM13 domain-containing protein [Dehalococcoides mccartyi]|nr:DM13 domain-containing protein [Dehalococcoides mccartyi]